MQLVVIYSWLTVVIHLKTSLLHSTTGRKLLANVLVVAIENSLVIPLVVSALHLTS